MGYTTTFDGEFTVTPPLTPAEAEFLHRFANTRHCAHRESAYTADGTYSCPGTGGCGNPHPGNPGLWCDWVPGDSDDDGLIATIKWNGDEKSYYMEEWIKFLIQHFLMPGASAATSPNGHVLNGTVNAQGEESNDRWQLVVNDNAVTRRDATITYEDGFREV